MSASKHSLSRSLWSKLRAAAALAAGISMTGCLTEGGRPYSDDTFTYISTEWQPKTVSLHDTRTGELLWSVDVPVGRQLSLGFRKGSGPNQYKTDMMWWSLTEAGRGAGSSNKSQLPVPPNGSRRLELTLRPAPELANATPRAAAYQPSNSEWVPVESPERQTPPPPPPVEETPEETPPIELPSNGNNDG